MRDKRPAASTLLVLNVCMCLLVRVRVCVCVCACVRVFVCVCVIGEHLSQYYLQLIPKHTIPMLRRVKAGKTDFARYW